VDGIVDPEGSVMWWVWALLLIGLLVAAVVALQRRGATGQVSKEEWRDKHTGPDTFTGGGGYGGGAM
jgi:hypothetical protein